MSLCTWRQSYNLGRNGDIEMYYLYNIAKQHIKSKRLLPGVLGAAATAALA